MKIRKAQQDDIYDIATIFRIETSKKPYCQKWTDKTALENIKSNFNKNDIYVMVLDNNIIGFIICEQSSDKKKVYVEELWILGKHQRKGYGEKVMKEIEKIYRQKQFNSISLVTDKRSMAFKFYKKINYKKHSVNVFLEKKLK